MSGAKRTALVTGAASGIGYATLVRLVRDGTSVVGADVDEGRLAEKLAGVARPDGVEVVPMALDVTDNDAAERVVGAAWERLGGLDVLVNVAGIGVAATLSETDPADFARVMAVNVTGVFNTCRAALPRFVAEGHGVIVNVSSVAGLVGVRNRAAYCASKAAVLGLTRSVTVDYAHLGVRANAVCPGTVDTEWIGKILANAEDPASARAAMEARQLDGRMGTPEEVAAMIAFLASDDARFANGSAFVLDGGMTAI